MRFRENISVKSLVKRLIRYFVFNAPWGAREAMLEAYIERNGLAVVGARLFSRMKITEVSATGDRGVVGSAWNDVGVLPEYAQTGTFSETITAAFNAYYGEDGGTFFDVGADIGLTTIPMARNPQVHCLAFEPEPVNFGFLQRNVARNAPDGDVHFHQIALFTERGSMALAIAGENIGDHRLTREGVSGRQTITIPTAPLDDFLPEVHGKLGVKIDTQGAEPFVVGGGQQVLARAGMLAIEFCPFLMRQLGGDIAIVIALVAGFDRVAVMRGGHAETPHFLPPTEAVSLLHEKVRTARDDDGDYLDVLAIRD
jgi:FkbM family methyltransferase